MADAATNPDAVKKLWGMIKDIGVAMMTTSDDDGSLRSRPMVAAQKEFDGDLWFFTRAHAHKVAEAAGGQQVNLAYAEPKKQEYVSLSGTAELVRDRGAIDAHWSEMLRTWFPKGKDDPEVALLKVAIHKAEYWDAPSSSMVYLYGYAKARTTGEPPHPGDNEKLNFA